MNADSDTETVCPMDTKIIGDDVTAVEIAFRDNIVIDHGNYNYEFKSSYSIAMENCNCVNVLRRVGDRTDQITVIVTLSNDVNKVLWDFVHEIESVMLHDKSVVQELPTETTMVLELSKIVLRSSTNEDLDDFDFREMRNRLFNATVEWRTFRCCESISPNFELTEIELVETPLVIERRRRPPPRHHLMPHINVMDIINAQTPIISNIETPIRDKLVGEFSIFMKIEAL
jgi:hypothetical protein